MHEVWDMVDADHVDENDWVPIMKGHGLQMRVVGVGIPVAVRTQR